MTTIDHQHPKVVFEATLSRYRVEIRITGQDRWDTYMYCPTMEEACKVAQHHADNDMDGNYRVVDTRPDTVFQGNTDGGFPGYAFDKARLTIPLTMDAYQEQAKATAVYPYEKADQYLIAGLAGEVGELASIFAKVWRGDGNLKFPHAAAELGDVLWFVAMLAKELGYDLSDVAQNNLNKLADRANRGKLKGSGDNR